MVLPAKVTASATLGAPDGDSPAAGLFDSSVTEDACVDYWLLPDRLTGHVDVTLQGLEPVARVLILNTQNGVLSRSRDRPGASRPSCPRRDRRVAGDEVEELSRLDRVRVWGTARADALRVAIVSFRGKGGGLNEIKILRQ